jgi:hypothetical protein
MISPCTDQYLAIRPRLGAPVIATTSTVEKAERLKALGGIVNLSRGGMLPQSVARWFGAGKSLARLEG